MTTSNDSGAAGSSSGAPRRGRSKKFLAPSVKYEIFLQLMRGETTVSAAAEAAGVDRSVITKLRQVAKEGAMAALSASKPGGGKSVRDVELEDARAEVARLSDTVKELAVKLMLFAEKGAQVGGEREDPTPFGCRDEGQPVGVGRHRGQRGLEHRSCV